MSTAPSPSISATPSARRPSRILRIIGAPFRFLLSLGARIERHWQNILTAFVQIWANKARSLLTTLGIIIAVTSTITVVSFVQGFGDYVTGMLRGFGTNMMFVFPWYPSGMQGRMMGRVTMDIDDVRAAASECDKVRRVSPLVFMGSTVEYGREKVEGASVRGTTEQYQSIRNFFVDKGRFFGPIDVEFGTYVCVVGREILKQLGCDDNIVDEHIFIDGLRFRVLGILEPKGQLFDENQDEVILIPHTTAVKMAPFNRRFMPFIVEATSEGEVEESALQLTRVLRARHGLRPGQPNDFRIFRQDELLRDFGRIQNIVTGVLAGIVGISLIVGGIGIMNVMLVSVTERTREIGLRKSVGGRRRDIMAQFLTEAVVLATLGGAIGITLGYGIGALASLHPDMVEVVVPAWIVILALGFSAGVGVVFGIVPAFKAAILHPIDALRHE